MFVFPAHISTRQCIFMRMRNSAKLRLCGGACAVWRDMCSVEGHVQCGGTCAVWRDMCSVEGHVQCGGACVVSVEGHV